MIPHKSGQDPDISGDISHPSMVTRTGSHNLEFGDRMSCFSQAVCVYSGMLIYSMLLSYAKHMGTASPYSISSGPWSCPSLNHIAIERPTPSHDFDASPT
jgi:hypothetical protein